MAVRNFYEQNISTDEDTTSGGKRVVLFAGGYARSCGLVFLSDNHLNVGPSIAVWGKSSGFFPLIDFVTPVSSTAQIDERQYHQYWNHLEPNFIV